MREQHIFPASVLDQSAEQILQKTSRLAGVLYLTVLVTVLGAIAAMNYIRVDVSVHASGVIKPREDHSIIAATANGYVKIHNLSPNSYVEKGDTLLFIRSEMITVKLPALEKRRQELSDIIEDLKAITTRSPYSVKLRSPLYRQDVLYYIAQWNEADARRKQAQQVFERSQRLYVANAIPLAEFETDEWAYKQAENAIRSLTNLQKRQWQSDLIAYETELRDVETQMEQINIQTAETVICAPVAGTIQQTQTLFDGSYVTTGQQIIEISPDLDLVAECYITPKDIGYIQPGMIGKLQVSAFNYTEWGMLQTTVNEIFEDVSVSPDGSRSFYKVYCTLDCDHLTLKNGYQGFVKKGMSVNANFMVTRRTVFQLLYDKINDWLNPYTSKDDESRN